MRDAASQSKSQCLHCRKVVEVIVLTVCSHQLDLNVRNVSNIPPLAAFTSYCPLDSQDNQANDGEPIAMSS